MKLLNKIQKPKGGGNTARMKQRRNRMRKNLFRGKTTDDEVCPDEWVQGFYTCFNEKEHRIYTGYAETDCGDYYPDYYKVIPETVGQCSTVADKNGVEMYEGDIVYGAAHWLERFKPAVVTFRDGSFGLLWHRGDVEEFDPFTSMCNVEYEVVGNIYDNPELMQGGETQ